MLGRVRELLSSLRRPRRAAAVIAVLAALGLGGYLGGRQLRAEYHYRAAAAALDRYDYPEAKKHLEFCLRAWPHGPATHLLAARAARGERDFRRAAEFLRRCRDLGCPPEAVELEHLLQRGYRREPADTAALVELKKRAAAGGPETAQVLEVLTQFYVDTFQLGEALIALNRLLELRPNNVSALVGRGWVHERLFEFPAAAANYREAVRLAPDNDVVRRKLAETLLITGPPAEALAQFERLQQRRRSEPWVLLGLARSHRQLGQLPEARALLDQLLAQAPGYAAALAERGKVALDADDLPAAERWLKDAACADPYSRDVQYNLSQCLLRAGRATEAEAYLARFNELDAELKRLGRVTRRIIEKPADADLRCEAGEICLRIGGVREGVDWLKSAVLVNPGHRGARAALARYYRAAGKAKHAERYERTATDARRGDGSASPGPPGSGAGQARRPP